MNFFWAHAFAITANGTFNFSLARHRAVRCIFAARKFRLSEKIRFGSKGCASPVRCARVAPIPCAGLGIHSTTHFFKEIIILINIYSFN